MAKSFNIRVYGIYIKDDMLLVNEELIRGSKIIKFPGGGLQFGEGLIDCLKREWKEELGLDIDIAEHFYTTDFFQPSAFDDSQVISIYYRIKAMPDAIIANRIANERTYWVPLSAVSASTFTLPIDKVVGAILQKKGAANM
jgi:8-oxo-dGTP diphosphatase